MHPADPSGASITFNPDHTATFRLREQAFPVRITDEKEKAAPAPATSAVKASPSASATGSTRQAVTEAYQLQPVESPLALPI